MMAFPKIINLVFILLVLIINSSIFGQEKLTDNWKEKLSKVQGQERVDLIALLSKEIYEIGETAAEKMTKEGIELAAALGDSSGYHKINVNLGIVYYYQGKITKGLSHIKKSLNYYERINEKTDGKARALFGLAMLLNEKSDYKATDSLMRESEEIYKRTKNVRGERDINFLQGYNFIKRSEYKTAKGHLNRALEVNEAIGSSDFITAVLMNLGIVEKNLGNLPGALDMYFQALKSERKDEGKAKCLNNISTLYLKLEEWDTALEYAEKSLALKKKIGTQSASIAISLETIGVIHKKKLNYGEALTYYEKCLAIRKKLEGKHSGIEKTISSIGNVYRQLGDFAKAMEHYKEALALAESNSSWVGICNARYNMGFALFEVEDYETALIHLTESYKIALEKESVHYLQISCAMLGNSYSKLGDEETAELYEKQYYTVRDSVFSFSKIKKIGNIEQQFKNDTEKDSLEQALKTYENNADKSRKNSFLYIAGLFVFILISAIFFLKFRIKSRIGTGVQTNQDTEEISNKLDHYFEELLHRFEEKGLSNTSGQTENNVEARDITNMTTFLAENLSTESNWKLFEQYFTKVHKDFFKFLKTTYPNISTNELNLCALLKLNIPNKEIAQIMGISYNSVRKAQHRLAKKIDISSDQVLRDFIIKL